MRERIRESVLDIVFKKAGKSRFFEPQKAIDEDVSRADIASLGLVTTNITSVSTPGYGDIRKIAINLNKAISAVRAFRIDGTWEFFVDPSGGPFVDIPMMSA